jgi:hypothetical protein
MMRSNSKQPFWLTGDMMPAAVTLSKRGWAGVSSFKPAERTLGGVEGMCCCCAPSAMVAMV